ncbi:MAG: DNA polymerase IV [candidate division Zixibacteria bacterium]|nr:DNA polymerase IV [candidate division Zixibacteria bacterium]
MGGIDRTKDWAKVIMHVDMDAFFAAFEIRNTPQLKGKPVIVGGDARFRSVVSTCSYEARKYGVKSGMPMTQAKRLCPDGIYVSGNLGGYIYTASMLIKIFEHYSPLVEPVSVDEAFLDITGCHRIFGTVENLVAQMKREIKERLSMTCSVGIAPTRLMAKMATGENKPDGVTIIDRDDFKKIFYPRSVDALWGVGKATREAMEKNGIKTVGELAESNEKELKKYFGKNGVALRGMARGIGSSEVYSLDELPDDKSMSHETTFVKDISDIDKIYATLLWLSDKVAGRLRREEYWGKTVTVKIRSASFKTITRDKTLSNSTDQAKIIYETARSLIPPEFGTRIKVRLLGVRVSHLEKKTDSLQFHLWHDSGNEKMVLSSEAVDKIRDRYGNAVIHLAGTRR